MAVYLPPTTVTSVCHGKMINQRHQKALKELYIFSVWNVYVFPLWRSLTLYFTHFFFRFGRSVLVIFKRLVLLLKLWTIMPVLLSMPVRLTALALLSDYVFVWCVLPKSYISWLWKNKTLQSRCTNGINSQNLIYPLLINQYVIYTRFFFSLQYKSLILQVLCLQYFSNLS